MLCDRFDYATAEGLRVFASPHSDQENNKSPSGLTGGGQHEVFKILEIYTYKYQRF